VQVKKRNGSTREPGWAAEEKGVGEGGGGAGGEGGCGGCGGDARAGTGDIEGAEGAPERREGHSVALLR
jgi:hypothetical protein